MSFFGELSRRNVIRVGIAYAIIAWLVIQVADIVLDTIGAPTWVMQTIMLLLALGFFITVIFAWAYEVTPEGIKRESEIDRSTSITGVTGRKLDRVITGLLLVALGYFIWESRFADRPVAEPASTEAATEAAQPQDIEVVFTPPTDLSIAVLPFENRSALAEDAFFAEGMHDDLLTTLAKIGSMKVISRTSVMEYRDTTKKIPEIAAELGVANILEGGVQRAGNQVRINVQLIDASTDEHMWAEIYDRELTAENLFAIQSEISKAIADALHTTLSPEEQRRIDTAPTDNLEAFDHYLRGRNLMATRAVEELAQATQAFLKAVELDPGFALAWVGVADSHALYEGYSDTNYGAFFDIRDEAISRALAIDPQLGEAYASLGILQNDKGDAAAAEESLKAAIRYSPNYATSYHWLSNMLRDNLFRLEESLAYAQRAAELDPHSAVILGNLLGTYANIGDFDNVGRYVDQLVAMHPDFPQGHGARARILSRQGNFADAIDAERKQVELDGGSASTLFFFAISHAEIGAFDEAREIAETLGEQFPDHPLSDLAMIQISIAEGAKPDIRPIITPYLEGNPGRLVAMQAGFAALNTRNFGLALDAFSLAVLDDLATMEYSQDFLGEWTRMLCTFSFLLLETTGNEERGRELLSAAIDMFENELPAGIMRPERFDPDRCYVQAGNPEKALDILERQLAGNDIRTWRWSLQNPVYDTLRDHPRFIALQAEFDSRMAEQLARFRAQNRPAFEF
jgi:TolB-like protein/Tfp pilus assembly protein PilF